MCSSDLRNFFFEKGGVYHAFGPDPSKVPMDQVHEIELLGGYMETGRWFLDADAHTCVMPQFPWERRAIVQCFPLSGSAKAGSSFDQTMSDGRKVKAQLVAGRAYPK